ncbi:hypothetical protein SZ54_3047 [Rhizobium sp. UR51a]|nr:hypothetical protein SZ54_3047 [Rhizobium sp. UR51a]
MWAFYSPKSSDSFMTWLPDGAGSHAERRRQLAEELGRSE